MLQHLKIALYFPISTVECIDFTSFMHTKKHREGLITRSGVVSVMHLSSLDDPYSLLPYVTVLLMALEQRKRVRASRDNLFMLIPCHVNHSVDELLADFLTP